MSDVPRRKPSSAAAAAGAPRKWSVGKSGRRWQAEGATLLPPSPAAAAPNAATTAAAKKGGQKSPLSKATSNVAAMLKRRPSNAQKALFESDKQQDVDVPPESVRVRGDVPAEWAAAEAERVAEVERALRISGMRRDPTSEQSGDEDLDEPADASASDKAAGRAGDGSLAVPHPSGLGLLHAASSATAAPGGGRGASVAVASSRSGEKVWTRAAEPKVGAKATVYDNAAEVAEPYGVSEVRYDIGEGAEEGIVHYLVKVTRGAEAWVVRRRYSEWHTLFASMPQLLTQSRLEALTAAAPFPPKTLDVRRVLPCACIAISPDTTFLAARAAALRAWLSAVVSDEAARRIPPVRAFVGLSGGGATVVPKAKRIGWPWEQQQSWWASGKEPSPKWSRGFM